MVTGRGREEASRLGLLARVTERMLTLEVPPGQAREHCCVAQGPAVWWAFRPGHPNTPRGARPRGLEQPCGVHRAGGVLPIHFVNLMVIKEPRKRI